MSIIRFEHKMAAHCESGAITALLTRAGVKITEPLVFGIGGGIFFGYLKSRRFPFPMFVVRSQPGSLRTNVAKRIGVQFKVQRFGSNRPKAQKALDNLIENNVPVAAQVDMYFMDYIPAYQTVHINVHFVVVTGKENGNYSVSDCYYPTIGVVRESSMMDGRFARGSFAPQGLLFYPTGVPRDIDWKKAVTAGIKQSVFYMLKLPIPFLGVRGIRYFADQILLWPKLARSEDQLAHEFMKIHLLLEEQGTGGGGFRFIYSSFLQQAEPILGRSELKELSAEMMENGDHWRELSLFVARLGKNRDFGNDALQTVREMLRRRADAEQKLFSSLALIVK